MFKVSFNASDKLKSLLLFEELARESITLVT